LSHQLGKFIPWFETLTEESQGEKVNFTGFNQQEFEKTLSHLVVHYLL
jgi:hypothetical protein